MQYVVTRIAKHGMVAGTKLYFCATGTWVREIENARKFMTAADAAKHERADLETSIETIN